MSFELESDEDDSCMPELGCEVSVEDLCCDADDESCRSDGDRPQPRRLTLEQRRRLNLYSKPDAQNLPVSAGNQPSDQQQCVRNWAIHDTPTIQEEDSIVSVSAATTDVSELTMTESSSSRVRTYSESSTADENQDEITVVRRRQRTFSSSICVINSSSKWSRAVNLVMQNIKNDCWRDKPVSSAFEEEVLRHRYNPHKRQWIQDRVRVKIENQPFDRGAMRECFRLKKLSTFSRVENWNSNACNFVAKRYIEEVDRSVYFEDVLLQMNAKLWAQEYNRHQPPKKVDIMQMCIIEFTSRDGSPLYHLEHHIEGNYVKYNSNSGFVDEQMRHTPQALSHFTFELSGHQLIVVDIQGVDDIYTDPQIHTANGNEYGDGNLGIRGMALFFQSHTCNEICHRLGLSSFDMAPSEISAPLPTINKNTCVRECIYTIGSPPISPPSIFDSGCGSDEEFPDQHWVPRRRRNTSGDVVPEEELEAISAALKRRERPTCAVGNIRCGRNSRSRSDSGGSDISGVLPGMPEVKYCGPILGRIHHEIAKLHESGRFLSNEEMQKQQQQQLQQMQSLEVDWDAVLYHEKLSADLGVVEAAVNLARLHLGLPADCLQEIPHEILQPNTNNGMQYLESAAKLGDRQSMLQLAKAYDYGHYDVKPDWDKAAHYYHQAISMAGQSDREGGYDCCLDAPAYQLSARLAELYANGGHQLDADPAASYECYNEAAESAMQDGNGKLAAKYYALAEEVAACIDD